MIKVVNKSYHLPTSNDVYIGRPSVLGNPYSHKQGTLALYKVESIEDAVNSYEVYIKQKVLEKNEGVCAELNRIYQLSRKSDINLVCWCITKYNNHCHGNVIKKLIEDVIK